ncbi:phage tail protein [Streptomyces sp. RB6PN25]|uniref:Phage tail protein n=1 Tax=Streptomyces humicola TaxID=2953240 RepID=A0ABT1Q0X3_9ACTN|nr:phage tail protein [Streptomyces humicola]
MDKSKAFTDWVKRSLVEGNVDGARQNVTITVMDRAKKPVKRIHLSNAWASGWDGPSLEAGANDPATETVTLAYEDIKVESV